MNDDHVPLFSNGYDCGYPPLFRHTHKLLVGGFNPPEKYEFVSWDDDIPNMMGKKSKYSKPPTRLSRKLAIHPIKIH